MSPLRTRSATLDHQPKIVDGISIACASQTYVTASLRRRSRRSSRVLVDGQQDVRLHEAEDGVREQPGRRSRPGRRRSGGSRGGRSPSPGASWSGPRVYAAPGANRSGAATRRQTVALSPERGLRAVGHAELAEDAREVRLDGLLADLQPPRDELVRQSRRRSARAPRARAGRAARSASARPGSRSARAPPWGRAASRRARRRGCRRPSSARSRP